MLTVAKKEEIVSLVTKSSETRLMSSYELVAELNKQKKEGEKDVTRKTLYLFFKSENFRSVKPSTKPGLNKGQRITRLIFVLQIKDWKIEDWMGIIFSDEISVILGHPRGRRRVWRRPWEANSSTCTRVRWKGFMEFMFWGCFCWLETGPCYCWPQQTSEMAKAYNEMMAEWNAAYEAEY